MSRENMTPQSPWSGAVVAVAGMGATCFALHAGQMGWGVWFAFLSFAGVALMNKVAA